MVKINGKDQCETATSFIYHANFVPIQPACVVFLLCPVWALFLLFNIIGSSPAWFVSNANLKSANKTKTNPLSTYIRCVLAQSNSYRSGNTIVKNCTEPEQSSLDLISSEPIPSNYLQPVQMRSQSYNMRPSSVRQVTMRNTLPDAMIQHPAHKFHGNSIY